MSDDNEVPVIIVDTETGIRHNVKAKPGETVASVVSKIRRVDDDVHYYVKDTTRTCEDVEKFAKTMDEVIANGGKAIVGILNEEDDTYSHYVYTVKRYKIE